MNLHKDQDAFDALSNIVSKWRNIPVEAVKRDYIIVLMLQKLQFSNYVKECVFKGGTSLSKCYPGKIERFSEDIDITYLNISASDKKKDKEIKNIENIFWQDMNYEKINSERSKTAKSSYVWLDEIGDKNKIKLEIGSNIRPEPYKEMKLKTYFQEYLEEKQMFEIITEYELSDVKINVLDITRTFLDKVLAVKRHAHNND